MRRAIAFAVAVRAQREQSSRSVNRQLAQPEIARRARHGA